MIKQKLSKFLENRCPAIFANLRKIFWYARNQNLFLLYKKRNIVRGYTDKPFYLNIGGFIFLKDDWRVLEYISASYPISKQLIDFNVDLSVEKEFPIPDETCDIVYSSHTLEHIPTKNVSFCLKECKRILREGGTLRIVVPDADIACDAYENNDRRFFESYRQIFKSRGVKGEERMFEDYLLEWFTTKEESIHQIGHDNIRRSYYELGRERFLSEHEIAILPEGHDHRRHVTWFTFDRLKTLLAGLGFRKIGRSGYLQSRVPELRNEKYFDPNPHLSLYVEAIK